MFCGMGSINGRSISNLSKELRWELMCGAKALKSESYDIGEVASRAYDFLAEKYAEIQGDPAHGMSYYIGGYGSDAKHGEVWQVSIIAGAIQEPFCMRPQGDHGVNWGGQISPIGRLINGLDPQFGEILTEVGMQPQAISTLENLLGPRLATPLSIDSMPTADAIRFADFLSEVTKGYYSFADGADIVGGATDIATISKWEGFKWVRRKHYYPRELNGGDHGHVC